MKALILVGGYGTRLRPLTFSIPKSVVPFCNLPILEYQVAALAQVGVTHIILAINYHPEPIIACVEGLSQKYKVKITCSKENQPLGTAGPIKLAKEEICQDNQQGMLFVFNSDVICDFRLQKLLEQHRKCKGLATIYLSKVQEPSRFGVAVTQETRITRFVEKPKIFISNLVNAGIYLLDIKTIQRIPEGFSMIEKDVFPQLAQEGLLHFLAVQGYWRDIGQPIDYLQGQKQHLDFINSEDSTRLKNLSLIHPSAKVHQTAQIGPYAVIGPNCQIGEAVRVKNSAVYAGSKLNKASLVSNSIIGWSCKLGRYSQVLGQSVLGEQVQVSEQTRVMSCQICPQKSIVCDRTEAVIL